MIEPNHPELSVRKQCDLLGINRLSLYLEPQGESETNLKLMRQIAEIHTKHPFYGCRKFAAILGVDKDHANRLHMLLYEMTELSTWDRRAEELVDRRHRPWDDEDRRPSHEGHRNFKK